MKEGLDSTEQRNLIEGSAFLSVAYRQIYEQLIEAANVHLGDLSFGLEIGAAGGLMPETGFTVLTSDVRADPELDLALDGRALPFKNESLDVIFMKDSLHHIPDVEVFFDEAIRVLRPGGGVVCVDPYWGPCASFIYRYFHPEKFDLKQSGWSFSSARPEDANQATLGILLRRDRRKFESVFPELEIIEGYPLLGLAYVASGGVTRRPLISQGSLLALHRLEGRSILWRRFVGLEYLVTFRKRLP